MAGREPGGTSHFVGKKATLMEAKRSLRTLEGRDVLIVCHEGVFHALDLYCYHSGGELQGGEIEELGGQLCIICPKHKYKITLAKGEGIYKLGNQEPGVVKWLSKGVKQRVHTITEADGDVYVTLRMESSWVESDFYQGEKGKVERAKARAAEKSKASE